MVGKRMAIIGGIIVLAFIGIYFLSTIEFGTLTYNPYGEKEIKRETRKTLTGKDHLYQVSYDDFEEKIYTQGEEKCGYVFSKTCTYYISYNTKDYEVFREDKEYIQFNALEYSELFNKLDVEEAPTIIYFADGNEVDRLEGMRDKKELSMFVEQYQ